MLNLIIAETGLETIPEELFKHPSLKKIRNNGKKPTDLLLDRTLHHFAILSSNLEQDYKRARPDISHIILLSALATPLFKKNQLKVFIHTINDHVIKIGDNLRIPKSYTRYEGLILDVIKNRKIISREGHLLLEFNKNLTFLELIQKHIKPDIVIGFSTNGISNTFEYISKELSSFNNPCAIIGGFPKGHFSQQIESHLTKKYSISSTSLEAHVVVSRLIYEYEKINNC